MMKASVKVKPISTLKAISTNYDKNREGTNSDVDVDVSVISSDYKGVRERGGFDEREETMLKGKIWDSFLPFY